MKLDIPALIPRIDSILANGLCAGVGTRAAGGQMCIEAALCYALDLPHGDDPGCVAVSVRSYKICLNDAAWSSPQARAKGLRDLGIAQLGSKGVVDDKEFAEQLAEQTIRVLLPKLFRQIFPNDSKMLAVALRCENEGSYAAAAAAAAADAAARYAAAADAADAAAAAAARYAAAAAADAADAAAAAAARYAAAADADEYLNLSASLALQILKDLKSPGAAYV